MKNSAPLTATTLSDWDYTEDSSAQTVTLTNFKGSETELLIPGEIQETSGKKVQFTGTSMANLFAGNTHLVSANLEGLGTSSVTDMNHMFNNTANLSTLKVSNWDTSNVTNMNATFRICGVTSLDVSKWNTFNVTNMAEMFGGADKLSNLDLSSWNTSKVTDMHYMFYADNSLTNLDISKWDVSNVIT